MLGLDWTELALILVVAVVIIGPKDLPEAVRGVARFIQKLRGMAGQFQTQVDEVVREAKLDDVRNQINEIRSFDFRSVVEKEVDKDGTLRKTFTEDPIGNPLKDAFAPPPPPGSGAIVTPPPEPAPGLAAAPAAPAHAAPAFVPPTVAADLPPAPAFVPPPPAAAPAPPSGPTAGIA